MFEVTDYSDACDVTLSVYPHRASLKNMPDHGGNRTYDLCNTSPMLCQLMCGYTLRVTSQASYSPEYITPTQKKLTIEYSVKHSVSSLKHFLIYRSFILKSQILYLSKFPVIIETLIL
jgi:hypothetical protein